VTTSPLVLHIVRPYATVEEYLDVEAWTIDARAMLLVDAPDLAVDTVVLFDVALRGSSEKLIRAEGRVAGRIAGQGDRPGGLRIKFKRYGAATKAFIDRAVQAQKIQVEPPTSIAPVSRNSVTEIELLRAEAVNLSVNLPVPVPVNAPAPVPAADPAPAAALESRPEAREPSGVHRRPAGPVEVPAHRDALLARLRERAVTVDLDAITARAAADKTG
jgi:hypothetical protein